jgi:hypothetical protein
MPVSHSFHLYTRFGDDPFVVVIDGVDHRATFSAWTYPKERCREICEENSAIF